MSRMDDQAFAQADKLVRELYAYLDKHGEDGDEFNEVYRSAEAYVEVQDRKASKGAA